MNRRVFLSAGVAAVAIRGSWRFLTGDEAATLAAVCEQIIPGAGEAGVVNYIDIQLTRAFKRHRATYRKGLADVDARSGGRFAELAPDRQAEVLRAVEKNSREFFELILAHARQGFYGDPRHGGNRGMVSWKMVGLTYPPIRGRG
jgi:gluconate 2-dehydrogenase gamma chain